MAQHRRHLPDDAPLLQERDAVRAGGAGVEPGASGSPGGGPGPAGRRRPRLGQRLARAGPDPQRVRDSGPARDGDALVTWEHWTAADLSTQLWGRWISRDGAVGAVRQLTPSSHTDISNYSVSGDLAGDVMLTWDLF